MGGPIALDSGNTGFERENGMRENVVLIGAGSAMFTRGLVADLILRNWKGELRLVDIDPAALKVAEGVSRKMIRARGAPLMVKASTDRRKLLPGATAVICTIGVGGRRAWEKDVLIPRKHGIYQPVGDTVMPGGTSRALRMIPPMVAIAEDVMRFCPRALFFNYGNPMSPVCRGVYKATGANMVGLCHGVFLVANSLAARLEVEPSRMRHTAVGINHLTWFTEVRVDGRDVLPKLAAMAREALGRGPADVRARRDCRRTQMIVTWQLLELFGAYPAVGDRHITEFFPHLFGGKGAYHGRTLGVDEFSFEDCIAYGDRTYAEMAALAKAPGALSSDYFERMCGEHEQVLDIIESVRTDAGRIYSANLPNRGQVPNLPAEAVVESPAIASAAGLRPIQQPPLSAALCGTLATRFQWVETVVEAALEGDRNKFVQALVLDGAVPSIDVARTLADELLAAHQRYLPLFRKAK
jgi:alpha-galactosidase